MGVIGIDLAGSPKRWSGLCYLDQELRCALSKAKSDNEIVEFVEEGRPRLVAVDAPLSLPRSRASLEGPGPVMRECDRRLMEMGIKLLPLTLKPMQMLTMRGISLKRRLEELGYKVIEVYPGGAQDFLGIPRKSRGLEGLRKGLEAYGLRGLREDVSGDELDAATCALVGWMYLRGMCMEIGDPDEGVIVMPKKFK